jgi:hypothetical protein
MRVAGHEFACNPGDLNRSGCAQRLRRTSMTRSILVVLVLTIASLVGNAQIRSSEPPQNVAQAFDLSVTGAEQATLALARSMPEDRYNFKPTRGAFKDVRTFAELAKHIAVDNYVNGASLLGETPPIERGARENGPASIRTKAEVIKLLQDSFAYLHKAMNTVKESNLMEMIPLTEGGEAPRLMVISSAISHPWDIYGQMIEYLRMNGIDPQKGSET